MLPLGALLGLTVLTACSNDETIWSPPPPDPVVCWDRPHTVFLGLNGSVRQITETQWEPTDGEDIEANRTWMAFDAAGHITYYNPTGIEPGRMMGFSLNSYTYDYDEQQRLTQVRIEAPGEEPQVYTLTYGTGRRRVPLPVSLGPLDFFLLPGVERIEAEGTDFTCTQTDTEVHFITHTPLMRDMLETTVTYSYDKGGIYPRSRTVTDSYGGETLHEEQTAYRFGTDGRLTQTTTVVREPGEEPVRTLCTYHATWFLQPAELRVSSADILTDSYIYTYDVYGRPTAVERRREDSSHQETFVYTQVDEAGNWCEATYNWSTLVDLNHPTGMFRVTRDIRY